MRVFSNVAKKALDGCSGHTSHLPIASASADVVATTSLMEGLMNTLACPTPTHITPSIGNRYHNYMSMPSLYS